MFKRTPFFIVYFMKKIILNPYLFLFLSLIFIFVERSVFLWLGLFKLNSITEIPIDKYFLIIIIFRCFLGPIFEELIFRGWFNFNFRKFITLFLFSQFLTTLYDQTSLVLNLFESSITQNLIRNFYVYIFPIGFLNWPFVRFGYSGAFYQFIFRFPFILILTWILIKLFGKLDFKFKLSARSKLFLIYFSSFFFAFSHFNILQRNPDPLLIATFIPMCILLPLVRYKYGLKHSIILHSLFNLRLAIIYFNEFNFTTFLYYLGCVGVIGGLVWGLFMIKKEPVIL